LIYKIIIMPVKGVWFKGRRTPVVVNANSRQEAINKAKQNKKRGGNKVVSVRNLKGKDLRTANKGRWVRTGPNGEKPGESNLRGYGPKPK
jgi:hypothetical protein